MGLETDGGICAQARCYWTCSGPRSEHACQEHADADGHVVRFVTQGTSRLVRPAQGESGR